MILYVNYSSKEKKKKEDIKEYAAIHGEVS